MNKNKFYVKSILFLFTLVMVPIAISCTNNTDDNKEEVVPFGNNDTMTNNNNNNNNNNDQSSLQPCMELTLPPDIPVFDIGADFPDWSSSPYKLPYKIGSTFFVNQGNNTGFGHSGFWRFGYDFKMNIGTEIYAARSGIVVHANDGTLDGNPNGTNLITIQHIDSTVALYSHLTKNGVLVKVGDSINQGELIGLSGNTGNTGGLPHLHFSLHPCSGLPGLPNAMNCISLPVNFKNTEPNPQGLGTWQCYTALDFKKGL